MFENVIQSSAMELIVNLRDPLQDFYLAGGTGLALQLGHRRSEDFDFFSVDAFDVQEISQQIQPDKIFLIRQGTLHCLKGGIKLSFLFYEIDLQHGTHLWNSIRVAAWEDIVVEKIKTISQRGAKKDFYDLYAAIFLKSNISEICFFFLKRFMGTGINLYHVLKSIVFFEDAEKDPAPELLLKGKEWEWDYVKHFFESHIREFEEALIQ